MIDVLITQLIAENLLLRAEIEDLKGRLAKPIPVKPLTMEDTVPVLSRMYVSRCSIK